MYLPYPRARIPKAKRTIGTGTRSFRNYISSPVSMLCRRHAPAHIVRSEMATFEHFASLRLQTIACCRIIERWIYLFLCGAFSSPSMSILFYKRPKHVNTPEGPLDVTNYKEQLNRSNNCEASIPPELSFEQVVGNKAGPVCRCP